MRVISVRRADYEDLKELADLHRRAWVDSHGTIFPRWYVEERPFSFFHGLWEAFLNDDQRPVLVASQDSRLYGFVRYGRLGGTSRIRWSGLSEIHTIYVAPEMQGRSIGSTLLSYAERAMSVTGAKDAILSVSAERTSAIGFYSRHGWSPYGERYMAEYEGVHLPFITMQKHLQQVLDNSNIQLVYSN
jgi:ribosomal protein S18 acetylase RimI-like enzyme